MKYSLVNHEISCGISLVNQEISCATFMQENQSLLALQQKYSNGVHYRNNGVNWTEKGCRGWGLGRVRMAATEGEVGAVP